MCPLQLLDRHLPVLVADLEVIDRHVVGDPRDPLLLGREQARQPVRGALADQDHPGLADRPVHHVHVPVGGDRRGHRPAAAHALQDRGGGTGLARDRRVLRRLGEPPERGSSPRPARAARPAGSGTPPVPVSRPTTTTIAMIADAGERDDRQRLGVGLADDPRDHADLLDAAAACRIGCGLLRRPAPGLFTMDLAADCRQATWIARLAPQRNDGSTSDPPCRPGRAGERSRLCQSR